jgi:hypothetical protein
LITSKRSQSAELPKVATWPHDILSNVPIKASFWAFSPSHFRGLPISFIYNHFAEILAAKAKFPFDKKLLNRFPIDRASRYKNYFLLMVMLVEFPFFE